MDDDENTPGLPPVDQIGFVVPDMARAVELYEPLYGPFTTMSVPMTGVMYRGKSKDCHLDLAFGRSGDLEIELIAVASGDSPHKEFLDAGGNGMHHLRYKVKDHDAGVALLMERGFTPIWSQRLSEDLAFTYLEREGDPLILEIYQAS